MPKPDSASPPPEEDPKLKAFNGVIATISRLSKAEQYAVLNAAAKYFEMSIKLEG